MATATTTQKQAQEKLKSILSKLTIDKLVELGHSTLILYNTERKQEQDVLINYIESAIYRKANSDEEAEEYIDLMYEGLI